MRIFMEGGTIRSLSFRSGMLVLAFNVCLKLTNENLQSQMDNLCLLALPQVAI